MSQHQKYGNYIKRNFVMTSKRHDDKKFAIK